HLGSLCRHHSFPAAAPPPASPPLPYPPLSRSRRAARPPPGPARGRPPQRRSRGHPVVAARSARARAAARRLRHRVHGRSMGGHRSEEHTSELQSRFDIVCRLLLEKKKHVLIRE